VKHLFSEGGAAHGAAGFISLDGAGLERIVVEGLGSRRYRVTASGAGGHSWVDWGAPNPIDALVSLGRRLLAIDLPTAPRTTLTIARIGGGTSINAIPQEAWLEIDTRSAGSVELAALEASVRAAVDEAAADHYGLGLETEVIGDRPGGRTPHDAPLVQAASAATRGCNRSPVFAISSTDSNVPMAAGVPSVTLGCGGEAGQAHTTDEWYRNVGGVDGIIRAFHTVLLAAGIADEAPDVPLPARPGRAATG
jgi:acetylornithine deacetylase/succinyl-diaminopimelate desuccinylase-like protein